jgi:hypothetical protein
MVATQGHIPGYQPMVCGGYHLRVIQVLLSYYPELLNQAINPGFMWWLSPKSYPSFVVLLSRATQSGYQPRLCSGYHLGVILTIRSL